MLIGVSGKKNAGKDEFGKMLSCIDSKYKIIKYADKLKDIICILLGCSREQLEDRVYKESPLSDKWWIYIDKYEDGSQKIRSYYYKDVPTDIIESELIKVSPRWLLQNVGTECFREKIHPDTWVNATYSTYSESSNWIITDVRFKNEADRVKELGGIVVRITRPTDDYTCKHRSEIELDDYDFDYVINNDGTLEDLKNKVNDWYKNLVNE